MDIQNLARKGQKMATDNAPTILTVVAVAGTITTAVLTGKATFRAANVILAEELHDPEMDKKARAKAVWKLYIPAAAVGTITVISVVGINRIGTRRTAAMAAAYTIAERSFEEYSAKVVEKIGEATEKEIRDEVAQDRVNRGTPPPSEVLVVTDRDKILCHDAFSNQYFYSDMEEIRRAENDINKQILHADYATVTDFYSAIGVEGLDQTSVSDDLGWNTDKFLEINYSTVLYKDKIPCLSISFATVPVREPWRFC